MKIEDNFLDKKGFDKLQTHMMGNTFSWYYTPYIDYISEKEKGFQFTHMFYQFDTSNSAYFENLTFILPKIKLISLWRIKTNLLTRTPNIVENQFHVDMADVSEEKRKQFTTSILYINTNNGYTEFEDGTKVESVANRWVSFPSNLKHRGTSCTDEKTRVVINFNYFK